MIGLTLITLGVMGLTFLNFTMQFFSLPYISNMTDAITWFFGLMTPFQGIWPLDTTFQCLFVLMLCYLFRFQIRFALEVILPMIPFIGKRIKLPHPLYSGQEEIEQHNNFKRVMRGGSRISTRD